MDVVVVVNLITIITRSIAFYMEVLGSFFSIAPFFCVILKFKLAVNAVAVT